MYMHEKSIIGAARKEWFTGALGGYIIHRFLLLLIYSVCINLRDIPMEILGNY